MVKRKSMLKSGAFLAIFIFFFQLSFAQNFNLEFQSNITFSEDCNDIWGFVDDKGTEYAVIGSRSATSIYSLEDPKNPTLRYVAPGARSLWRDIKYYDKHLYVTHDQDTFGLTIIDVSKAPDEFSHSQWTPNLTIGNRSGKFLRAHNIYIDEKGFAYLAGHNIGARGVIILDLKQDPKNPTYVGAADLFYSHDAYVKGDTLYSSELSNGFGIYDISDRSNPVEIGRGKTGNNFTHNAWLSDTSHILFTTDEVASGYVESYDVSDTKNIKFLDRFKTNPGSTRVIPHNTHVLRDFIITSWYTDGIIINDISDPKNIVKVGAYDTYTGTLPNTGSLYLGCWGVYPYLPSGLIIGSDINSGLFVLKPTYVKGAYLTGGIFSREKGSSKDATPLTGATVKVLHSDIKRFINQNEYKIGISPDSNIQVVFSHPDFYSDTITINLHAGQLDTLDYYFETQMTTSVPFESEFNETHLYPTVTNKLLHIESRAKNFSFEIINLSGLVLKTGKLVGETIDVQELFSGMYYLKLYSNKEAIALPFFKD